MYTRALSVLALFSFLLLTGCDALTPLVESAREGQSTIKPSPLQQYGNDVPLTVSVQVPEGVLKPKVMYELEVYYDTETSEPLYLGKLEYDGDQLTSNPSPQAEQDFNFAYEDMYKNGQVKFKGKAYKKSKPEKFKETEMYTIDDLGKGIITTQQLVMAPYTVSYVPHGYDNSEELIPNEIEFFFLQGRSNLRYSERRSDRADSLENYIQVNSPTRTINVTGMHSPEGPESVNTELASERAGVVEEYYKNLAEKYDYTSTMDSIDFVLKPIVQDWEPLKDMMMSSEVLTDAQKNEVLEIVNGPGDFVSKELKLQTLSFYRTLFRELYPPLRSSKVQIMQIKDKPTDAELAVMVKNFAEGDEIDNRSAPEIAYAASLTPDLQEKEKIYQASIRESDSYSAYNNLGAVYMAMALEEMSTGSKMEMVEKAADNFKLSLQKQKSTEAYVNLASAQLIMGDPAGAMETMGNISGSASGELGADIAALKAYAAITAGNYDEAISQAERAGNDPISMYNKALATLLKNSKEMSEDYSRAMSAFQDAVSADNDNGYAYYGAAISAARMGNADAVTSNLENAFEQNPELKERAVTDLEFLNMKDAVAEATK